MQQLARDDCYLLSVLGNLAKWQGYCAGLSGAVHSVFLIDVYLDLESPGGSGFWVGENRRVTEGNRKGQFASTREQRWTDPNTEGGFQVSRQGE